MENGPLITSGPSFCTREASLSAIALVPFALVRLTLCGAHCSTALIRVMLLRDMSKHIERLREKVTPILLNAGVTCSAVFGSYARGDAGPESDVDLLVELPGSASLFDLVDLKHRLEEALGREVDVLTYRSLHRLLRDRILNEAHPIL